ncbi:hypothetical protein A9Q84_15860 [Halobacteriovorax marinus]|uniref:Uncharacterized protein n=1 Tax=Halobacteriovorax marinus TaxID=97084 RepID=A0A1Y5F400_9BACT|nr:hypothetical protein A9Q84_15860 [Halobacteriovorax marinus]
MNLSKIIALVAIISMTGANAAETTAATTATQTTTTTSSNSLSDLYKQLEDGPASLSYSASFGLSRNAAHEYTGYTQSHSITTGYSLTDVDRVSLYTKYAMKENINISDEEQENMSTSEKIGAGGDYGYWDRIQLTYKRSGLRNQKDHGYNLSAGIDYRYYPNAQYREQFANRRGLIRPHITLTKSWDNGFGIWNKFNIAKDIRKNNSKNVSQGYFYLITDQSYSINDKFAVGITEEWFSAHNPKQGEDYEGATVRSSYDMTATAYASYQILPKVSLSLEVGSTIFKGFDQRFFAHDIWNSASWALGASFSVF